LSAVKPDVSACGRTNMRIKGWMGRADQTTKIKGMFVHAGQVEKVRKEYEQVAKIRLSVTKVNHNDQMNLQCELDTQSYSDADITSLIESVSASLKKSTNLSGSVELVAVGTLADDGKVIDDLRPIG
jgi:phenylacetate-CoA ligase